MPKLGSYSWGLFISASTLFTALLSQNVFLVALCLDTALERSFTSRGLCLESVQSFKRRGFSLEEHNTAVCYQSLPVLKLPRTL